MKLFIDTANIEEIKEIARWGILEGVTTNPSLIAKEGRDLKEVIEEIACLVEGPISAEVTGQSVEEMVNEGLDLASINKNIVVKIPMNAQGLEATRILKDKGVGVNVTLVFSVGQALLAAKAGASYVSPFIGRLDDIGVDGLGLIEDIAHIFTCHAIETQIIAASIRHTSHVRGAALAGSHIATIPYSVYQGLLTHPLTDSGIEKFLRDANK